MNSLTPEPTKALVAEPCSTYSVASAPEAVNSLVASPRMSHGL